MILKKLIEFNERLVEQFKKLIECRINKSWRKELRKIKTSSSRILRKESKINSFYDEISSSFENELINEENTIEIHLIAAVSFNILSRQKDVEIFVVFVKNLKIQLKKQESNITTDLKPVMSSEYHDFLNVFFKKKTDILSFHRKHDHCIKFEKNHESDHEYVSLYNLSKNELLSSRVLHSTRHQFCSQRNQTKNWDFASIIANWMS
jgi:hypothetical protein